MKKLFRIFCAILILSLPAFSEEEWTRFRGPNGSGIATSTNLPIEFGPEKNVVWKTILPPGHSSPVLTRSHIFVTAFDGTKLLIVCLDRKSGKIVWQRDVPRTHIGRLQNVN